MWYVKIAQAMVKLQGMDQNSFLLDSISRKAIKVGLMPTIKTAFLVMALHQNYLDLLLKVMLVISHFVKLVS